MQLKIVKLQKPARSDIRLETIVFISTSKKFYNPTTQKIRGEILMISLSEMIINLLIKFLITANFIQLTFNINAKVKPINLDLSLLMDPQYSPLMMSPYSVNKLRKAAKNMKKHANTGLGSLPINYIMPISIFNFKLCKISCRLRKGFKVVKVESN